MADNQKKKKVLIVEDEMDMRLFLITLVETSGFQPVSARDGREGIQKALEVLPDLIILDVMMPGEGGARMYGRLAAEARLKQIPVIILSAVGKRTFTHYLNMITAGTGEKIPFPAAYIEKPPEASVLLKTIKATI